MRSLPLIVFALAATAAMAWQRHGETLFPSDVQTPALAASSAPVLIYTMQGCPYCQAAIAYMEERGHAYVNHDVERDPDAYEAYMAKTKGSPGVPVLDIGGRIMQGWSRERFEELLAEG